ncbi:MAG: DUF6603 domain-containing protein [Kofleriaceae bacterium]
MRLLDALGVFTRVDLADTEPPQAPPPPPSPDDDSGDHLDNYELDPDEGTVEAPPAPPADLTQFHRRFRPRLIAALPMPTGPAQVGIAITASSAEHPDQVSGFLVGLVGALGLAHDRDNWHLALSATGDVPAFVIGPGGPELAPGTPASAAAEVHLVVQRLSSTDGPAFVLGAARGTRLELGAVIVRLDASLRRDRPSISLTFDTRPSGFVLAPGDGDGFLSRVLSREIRLPLDVGLVLSSDGGIRLLGGVGLETRSGSSIAIGPVTVANPRLALSTAEDVIRIGATCDVVAALGPVSVGVTEIGVAVDLRVPTGGGRWPASLDVGFRPPSGAAIVVASPLVSGGGFLARDAAHDRYLGGVSLSVGGFHVSGAGVLETRLPSGGDGYSLAAVIAGELTPIPIGLGFTLKGVGGLIGIHRRVDVEAVRAALRGPGVGDLFFAADPIAQTARLTSDLGRYFPRAQGRHIIGPAAKIGWGSPTLIEGEIAVLLEMPSPVRLVLLGNIRAALPTKQDPIIALNVDFVGDVDFAKKTAAIDATLRDSKVAGFPITGDFALRMSWGSPPSFVLSVGGFHSQFRPPPGFPALRRVRIPIGADEDPRLDIQGFLALTSNTAQIGAQVELYASAGPLNIKGSLGFEALLTLSPFQFRVDLWAGVALRRGNKVLAGVHLDGTLTGPTPWRIVGEACLSLWFIDLCVGVDATFGGGQRVELPPREIWPLLRDALQRTESWETTLPAGVARAVTTAPPIDEESPITRIDPAAAITVRQKVAPLNRRITRFAEAAPVGPDKFQITQVKLGTSNTAFEPVSDWFAPAQFEKLSDADRLSRPGFESMVGGVTVANTAATAGAAQVAALTYETILIQGPSSVRGADFRPTSAAQIAAAALGGAALAPLRPPAHPPPRVVLEEETYVIASTADLAPRFDLLPASPRGVAELALDAFLAANPSARGTLHVVPSFEAAP